MKTTMTPSGGDGAAARPRHRLRRLAGTALGLLGALLTAVALAQPAYADFGFAPGATAGTYKADGTPETQAGATPFTAETSFALNSRTDVTVVPPWFPGGTPITQYTTRPDGAVKDIVVDVPSGVVGNPQATPRCPRSKVKDGPHVYTFCPPSTQVGIVKLTFGGTTSGITGDSGLSRAQYPVYNMVPRQGDAAEFAFAVQGFGGTKVVAGIRPTDHGLRTTIRNISVVQALVASDLTFWGVPADPSHDKERNVACPFLSAINNYTCEGPGTPSGAAPKAFMRNPTVCDGSEPVTRMQADSWQEPGVWKTGSAISPKLERCERLPFPATATIRPDSTRAASPTGLDVAIDLRQSDDPTVLATADLKTVVVKLPAGMAVSPSAANGLAGCSTAQIGLDSNDAPTCPDQAQIGSVQIKTPLLPDPLEGEVYLASQDDNPFHSLLALYLVAHGQGVMLKLPGKVSPDPRTGQLTASFAENPQLPFEELKLHLEGGERAALVNPSSCGTYATSYQLGSWGGQEVDGRSSFDIDQGCDTGGFDPGFAAGSANPVAGSYSPFTLRVTRRDGELNLATIAATLPEGMLAKLAGVPLCGDAQAATGACPPGSRVGSVAIGAGAGPTPVYLPQPGKAPTAVYLAGPYKGAPYSLVVKVPAQAGPFDLGTVAVRTKLDVDPATAQVSAASDPMPQILQGIPVAYRDVRVNLDRPRFTLNPTSCEPMSVDGTIGSAQGSSARVRSRFQVGDCGSLDFGPSLKLRVKGGTKRGKYQKLKAVLRAPRGQANIGKVSVNLPHSEFLAQEHIRTICTRVQYAADRCPKGSVYGRARAWTPLLDKPLEGPVYLRSSDHPLPDLVASLDGQIHIDLAGRIDSRNGGIRTTFDRVPDAPVSTFVLDMKGGKKSLLVNSRNLCRGVNRAIVKMRGQNGKVHDFRSALKSSCGKAKKKRGARHRRP